MVKLVEDLTRRPRGRACFVLTHDYTGQREWAEELARRTEAEHLDLLGHFVDNADLCHEIDQFTVDRLFDYLTTGRHAPVLIVSRMDFLKATWIGHPTAVESLASHVENWQQNPALLLVLQYDESIASRSFRRFRQYTFVVDQRDTLKL